MIELEIGTNELNEAQKRLMGIKQGLPRALMRAINRTVKSAQVRETRLVRDETGVPTKKIRTTFSMKRARLLDLEAETVSKGYQIPLIYFRTRPKNVVKRKPKIGVSAVVRKSEGRQVFKGSFIGHWPHGNKNVLKRSDKKRFPVKIVRGPAVPEVLADTEISTEVKKYASERLTLRVQKEVDFLLEQAAK